MNALREVAAKVAADLARVTHELEREKKRNNASKALTSVTSPANAATTKAKKSAAAIMDYEPAEFQLQLRV